MAKKQPTRKKTPTSRKVNTKNAQSFSAWQLALLSVSGFGASYVFASLAIDSGSLWHYLLCFASVYLAITFASQTITALTRDKK